MKRKIIYPFTAALLVVMTLATVQFTVEGATGFIEIDPATTIIPQGGDINLNFGGVDWQGAQFALILSADNSTIVSSETAYSPLISVTALNSPNVTTYNNSIGGWRVGNRWVNGSTPNVANGVYYIKGFDGMVTQLAVTGTSFIICNPDDPTVNTYFESFEVSPTTKYLDQSITLSGKIQPNRTSGYTVEFYFIDPNGNFLETTYNTDSGGVFNFEAKDYFNVPGNYSIWAAHPIEWTSVLEYTYSESAEKTVTVLAADFSITASPTSRSIYTGESTDFDITVTSIGGFSQPVALNASASWPQGYMLGLDVGWINPTPTGTSTKLMVTTGGSPVTDSVITITGTAGVLTHATTVTLTVASPLQVSVNPPAASVEVGQSATFTATVLGGVSRYTYQWFEGSTPMGSSATFTISKSSAGTYSFYCRVRDSANNTVDSDPITLTATVHNEDTTPPTTEILLSGTSGENGWYTSNVLVTLSASDDFEVLETEYSFNNADWQTYDASFTVSSQGRVTIHYRSIDRSFNVEPTKTREIKIDKTPPTGTLIVQRGDESTDTINVTLELHASDTTSGITQMRFSNNGITYSSWQAYEESVLWTLQDGSGNKTVYVQFKDEAGLTSTSVDSIELSSQGAGTASYLDTDYIIVAAVIVAAGAGIAAIAWFFAHRYSAGKIRKFTPQPPPILPQLRWIQARVYEIPAQEKPRIRRTNVFHANVPHNLEVRIGPADTDWLTSPEEGNSQEDKKTSKNNISQLQVVFSEPNHSPEPQTKKIALPQEGPSPKCQFTFNPRREVPYFRGRVIVLNQNRVLQTALLEGKVVTDPEHFPDLKLNFEMESIIQPNLGDLSFRKAFDLTLVANRTKEDSPGLTTIAGEQAFFNRLAGMEMPISEITKLLEGVVKDPEKYSEYVRSERDVHWLWKLAIRGKELYNGIVVDQIGPKRILNIDRVQLVSTVDDYLPLEFIYDMPAPKPDAPLCPKWREALDRGYCEKCKIRGTFPPADFLCPIGFWGLRLIIERHYLDPYKKPDLKGYTFALKGSSVKERPTLKVLRSAVFAASAKVDSVVLGSKAVLKVLQDLTHNKVEQVTTWDSWKKAVVKLKPSLIVLLTHIAPYSQDPGQAQMEIGDGIGLPQAYISSQYLLPSEDSPKPLVLLLGCSTMSTVVPFRSFAASLKREGAAVVLSTITKVLGRHVAPVSAQLIHNLEEAAEKGLSLGDALVLVRRKLLADGFPVVLSLVAIGDADMRFETAEAG